MTDADTKTTTRKTVTKTPAARKTVEKKAPVAKDTSKSPKTPAARKTVEKKAPVAKDTSKSPKTTGAIEKTVTTATVGTLNGGADTIDTKTTKVMNDNQAKLDAADQKVSDAETAKAEATDALTSETDETKKTELNQNLYAANQELSTAIAERLALNQTNPDAGADTTDQDVNTEEDDEEVEKVMVNIPKDFNLTLPTGIVAYKAGAQTIPVEHAEHWYAVANGVKKAK